MRKRHLKHSVTAVKKKINVTFLTITVMRKSESPLCESETFDPRHEMPSDQFPGIGLSVLVPF